MTRNKLDVVKKFDMQIQSLKRRVVAIDEQGFTDGVAFVFGFSKKFKLVNAYTDATTAIDHIKIDKPEIILTEVDLPGLNGLDAIRKIKEDYPGIEILVVSDNNSSEVVQEAFSAGASGFLSKNEDFPNQLLRFLDSLDQGGSPLSSDVARKIVESYWRNPTSPLSHRETSVLKLISQGNTYSEIGKLLNISSETSKTHIRNIYKKLSVKSRSEAVQRGIMDRLI